MATKMQMRQVGWWTIVIAIVAGLGLWALQGGDPAESATTEKGGPATVEHIEGSELGKVTLTERANQRLDIQIGEVTEQQINGATKLTAPYGAIFYDAMGRPWLYTNPDGLSYVRAAVTIERIEGGTAVLEEGPAVGTKVVSVGAALLYGTEFGVGH